MSAVPNANSSLSGAHIYLSRKGTKKGATYKVTSRDHHKSMKPREKKKNAGVTSGRVKQMSRRIRELQRGSHVRKTSEVFIRNDLVFHKNNSKPNKVIVNSRTANSHARVCAEVGGRVSMCVCVCVRARARACA